MTASVSLADIATRIDVLETRCGRCDRQGRLSVSRLIARYGGSMILPDLRTELTRDCEHAGAHDYARCDVFFPQLATVAPG